MAAAAAFTVMEKTQFPVGEGEDLSTKEQISKMNVVIILLDTVK